MKKFKRITKLGKSVKQKVLIAKYFRIDHLANLLCPNGVEDVDVYLKIH